MFHENSLKTYKAYLLGEEKSPATIEKYMRDIIAFKHFSEGQTLCKTLVLSYKNELLKTYAPSSVNSMLSSLNGYFQFFERYDLKVKNVKIQKQIFCSDEKELSKTEYERLLRSAKNANNERLCLLMQTICSTGIRVSELKFITAEAVRKGFSEIFSKGKRRTVFLPNALCKLLKNYLKKRKIKSGSVFITKNGNPLNRSNIWSEMKKLCENAGVSSQKVFPHNLRHLFARTHYSMQKDIVRLADILGHSSINTTRIYTIESGEIHRKQIQRLGLLYMT